MFVRPFAYRKRGAQPFQYGTWDTETSGLGGDLICITAYVEGREPVLFASENMVEDFLDYIENTGICIWYAHNLSYDLQR